MENRRSQTSWCHSRHSCCTGSFQSGEGFWRLVTWCWALWTPNQTGPSSSPSSFLVHQSSGDAWAMYQLFYPLPVELHVSQHETLLPACSQWLTLAQRKSKLVFMLILLLTTPVQNWTLTFPLPLLFCLPSLTGKSCSRGSLWFMAVWLCPAAVAALPHCVVFGLFGGVFKAFSLTFSSKDHGAEGHLLFTEALRILV